MRMIEVVARALCKCHGVVDHSPVGWQWYVPMARAAIGAMREPDEAMRLVFTEADWKEWPAESSYVVAIDKALADREDEPTRDLDPEDVDGDAEEPGDDTKQAKEARRAAHDGRAQERGKG